jgi:AcrR family transcriptional regulator
MRKGEATKQEIFRQAAPVFNRQGFAGSSLSDIMAATGLQKGGIYNHFESKEQLALETFDYAAELMRLHWEQAVDGRETAQEQLEAFIEAFSRMASAPEIAGGCPLLNTAIESDDTNLPLRDRVREAFSYWRGWLASIVRQGRQRGEMQADAESAATLILSTLEGALMLSQLYEDDTPLQEAAVHLTRFVRRDVCL